MNLKANILKIAVVIALICMLVPVIAAEDVDDSAVAESVDDTDVVSVDDDATDDGTDDEYDDEYDDETDDEDEYDDETDDEDIDVVATGDEVADLQIAVITPQTQVKVGDLTNFGIVVYNNGPDMATNVLVRVTLLSGAIDVVDYKATQGVFSPYLGLWYVGDLAPGQFAVLSILGQVLSSDDIYIAATVSSDAYDPDLSNNLAFGFIDVVGAAEPEEASEVLPEAGNPVALALLALLSIAGVSFRRLF